MKTVVAFARVAKKQAGRVPAELASQILPWVTPRESNQWRPLQGALKPDSAEDKRAKAKAAYEDERAQAVRDGHAEGIKKARTEVMAIMKRYQDAVAELATLRDRIMQQSHDDLVRLAVKVAQTVIVNDTHERTEFTTRMIQHALGLLREADQITMRLAPTDLGALKKRLPDLFAEGGRVRIVEDPRIALGGVIADCSLGRVDATIERRLADVTDQLLAPGPASTEGET